MQALLIHELKLSFSFNLKSPSRFKKFIFKKEIIAHLDISTLYKLKNNIFIDLS
jgi:hypothetical protein